MIDRLRRSLGMLLSALLLNACTFVYVESDSNHNADSDNHSGTLSVPERKAEHGTQLLRLDGP